MNVDVSIAFLGQTIPYLGNEERKEGNKKRVRKISAARLFSCFNVKETNYEGMGVVSCAIDTSTYETTTTLHPSSTSSSEPSTESIKRDIKQKKTLLRNLTSAPSVMVSIDRIDVSQLNPS